MPEYKLPDVGEGLTEADIVAWKVKVGDVIAVNDVVVEIETAKSLVELPSPYAGTVTALLVKEGDTVEVGTPIIAVGSPDLEIDLSNPAASGGGEGESLVGRNKAEGGIARRARKAPSGAAAANVQTQAAFEPGPAPVVEVEPEPTPAPLPTHVLAKPPVRKLAKDLGVDLATCAASGPHGTVTRADVEAAAGTSSAGDGQTSRPYDVRETREPIKGVRKAMGEAMVRSAFTVPHVTEWVTIDVTRTVELVERLQGHRELRDVKVSPLLVLAKAVLLAMRRTPVINSLWDDAAGEVVHKHYVNLGIAAATPRGLVVPNVKDAHDLALPDLARALAELTATAREGRTQPAEMSGGTFTITNVGPFGVDGGTPIINPGESAILCFGAIKKAPWVVDDEIVVRHVCTLALSFDHRHIDGEAGSRFLADVAAIMSDPASSLLF